MFKLFYLLDLNNALKGNWLYHDVVFHLTGFI